jgi:hypothetical protein
MSITLELKLVSAQIGDFLVTGEVEVEFEYSVHEEITEVDGPTCRIERDLYVDYVYNVVPVDLVIEHPSWDVDTKITHPDSTDDYQPDYNLWSAVLNNLPDEWWNDEIVYNNNLWEYIDD